MDEAVPLWSGDLGDIARACVLPGMCWQMGNDGGGGAPLLVVGAALYCLPSPCHPKAKARYAVSNNDFDKVDADADSWWHANGTHTLSLPTADGDGRGVYVLPEGTVP